MSEKKPKHPETPQVLKLKQLVVAAGGPTAFAKKYSKLRDQPIDPTYVSQILNGHRAFRDVARKNMAMRAGLDDDYFETSQMQYSKADDKKPQQANEARQLGLMTSDEIDLVIGFRNAPEAVRTATLDHMRLYAKTGAAAA